VNALVSVREAFGAVVRRAPAVNSSDLESAKQAIRSTYARGTTALYNGVYLTLKELTKQRKGANDVRRQAIVVLSDGDDTSSLVSFDDVMDLAKESGISTYTIMLKAKNVLPAYGSLREGHAEQSEFAMKALAQETGGRSFFPREVTELAGIYGVSADAAVSWAIGYHLLSFVPITLIGAWYFLRAGLSMGEISGAQRSTTEPVVDGRASPSAAPGR
jgi:hypothetical protein